MIHADPGVAAGTASAAELSRRRRAIVRVAFAVVPSLVIGAFRISTVGRERRPSKYCDVDVSLLLPERQGESSNVGQIPCEFETVSVTADWQWPVVIATLIVGIGAAVALWLLQPRMMLAQAASDSARRVAPLAGVAPLTGTPTGSGTRLTLRRSPSIFVWILTLTFGGIGIALLMLPSGAPPVFSVMCVVIGLLAFRSRHLGLLEANHVQLRVGRTLRRTSWNWSDIESVEAKDLALGPFGQMRSAIVVTDARGRVFAHEEVSTPARVNGPSRAERAVVALVPYGGAKVTPPA